MTRERSYPIIRVYDPDDTEFMKQGNCVGVDPNLMHPERGARRADIDAAKAVCAGCTQQEPCLAYALRHNLYIGIWGSTTGRERRAMRRRAS